MLDVSGLALRLKVTAKSRVSSVSFKTLCSKGYTAKQRAGHPVHSHSQGPPSLRALGVTAPMSQPVLWNIGNVAWGSPER